jgi:hypothetical protein
LPPGEPKGPRERPSGKPARKRPGSIRDAAASAAGSAPRLPSPAGAAPPPTPADRPSPPISPDTPRSDRPIRAPRSRRKTPERPAFPDFDTPSAGWDPWDQTIEGPPGDEVFDPNRTLGDWLEAVIPAEAQVHFIRAGQEFAAGVQTTVDHHLGRREPADGTDGATRIEIE